VDLTAAAIKVANFWDVAPCGPYMNQCFGKFMTFIFRTENQPNKTPAYWQVAWQGVSLESKIKFVSRRKNTIKVGLRKISVRQMMELRTEDGINELLRERGIEPSGSLREKIHRPVNSAYLIFLHLNKS
jgi:hypothetical protein